MPDETRVFCGHEYTQANIRFALTVEPDNKALAKRAAEADRQLAAHQATIPVTIGAEKAENPFLRADIVEVAKAVGLAGEPAWKVFAEIRERKNKF
jgi:hydroxyacylglutathione hydrolase